jgi:hypothetical protein
MRQCDKCSKSPSFNVVGERRGRFCATHAEPGMVDTVNRRCEYATCKKQPAFNVEGELSGRFCKQHSEAGSFLQRT